MSDQLWTLIDKNITQASSDITIIIHLIKAGPIIILLMRKINQVVQYDFERNTFYKINKDTGAESPTYKNGEEIKKFRPEITGRHYLIRRKSEKTDAVQSQSRMVKQRSYNTDRLIPEYSYFKNIEGSRRDSKATEASVLMRSTISSKKKQLTQAQADLKDNSFFKMKIQMVSPELSKQKSSQKLRKEIFNQTLTNYTKILKDKPRENNSPKKDLYAAGEIAKDPLQTLCTTISHFRVREPVWNNNEDIHKELQKRSNSPAAKLELSAKQLNSRQRSLFLDFHPEYKSQVNAKSIEVQVDRKKNLKILEDLFIRQNNKATRRIYQSIA